ncbi:hypothetical protein ASPSYDRAFT_353611 [Aspergillus sydowii CBS 593.65]|uniref:Uncharacterized protein n=1 Tax=Aspergillus sydowii CBS 593.65 TaxID=1036612 RepID=A0A1L9TZR4_9EURO|nr:uncharacterized protein ASPSYDRAFT_353611 [Aspergillus sydowii CBS 593.65]OJJ64868.1 hypothetical protein ASPSYDRAFT_353611 [Aspergillus sydowii CBS 593.65]
MVLFLAAISVSRGRNVSQRNRSTRNSILGVGASGRLWLGSPTPAICNLNKSYHGWSKFIILETSKRGYAGDKNFKRPSGHWTLDTRRENAKQAYFCEAHGRVVQPPLGADVVRTETGEGPLKYR